MHRINYKWTCAFQIILAFSLLQSSASAGDQDGHTGAAPHPQAELRPAHPISPSQALLVQQLRNQLEEAQNLADEANVKIEAEKIARIEAEQAFQMSQNLNQHFIEMANQERSARINAEQALQEISMSIEFEKNARIASMERKRKRAQTESSYHCDQLNCARGFRTARGLNTHKKAHLRRLSIMTESTADTDPESVAYEAPEETYLNDAAEIYAPTEVSSPTPQLSPVAVEQGLPFRSPSPITHCNEMNSIKTLPLSRTALSPTDILNELRLTSPLEDSPFPLSPPFQII